MSLIDTDTLIAASALFIVGFWFMNEDWRKISFVLTYAYRYLSPYMS